MHLNLVNPATGTGFTTPALDIEAEAALVITAQLGFIGLGKEVPYIVEDPRVGSRVTTRRPADWALINVDDLV